MQKQTVQKLRTEFYYPKAATRTNYDGWVQNGSKDTWTLAEERAKEILKNHKPTRLPEDIVKKIREKEPGIIIV